MASSKTIAFRASGELLARLEERSALEGKSEGELARELTQQGLEQESQGLEPASAVHAEPIEELRQSVLGLRRDLATVMEMLLLNVAKIPEQQVRDFVSRNLRG